MAKKLLLILLPVLAVGLVVALYWRVRSSPRLQVKPEHALGEVVASESAKLLSQGGDILVISGAGDPLLEAQVSGIEAAAGANATIKVLAVERLKPVDLLLRTRKPGSPPYETAEFRRALQAHDQVNAVVSLVGFPVDELPEWPAMRQRGCKSVAVFNSSVDPEMSRCLEQRQLDVAIVAREDVRPAATPPKTDRELFDEYYVIARSP